MGNALVKSAAIDMGLQWALFLVAAYFKTEKFYDLAGSGTFILLAVQSLISNRKLFPRQVYIVSFILAIVFTCQQSVRSRSYVITVSSRKWSL